MDNYSFDTVQLIRDHFTQLDQEANAEAKCNALLEQGGCRAALPGRAPTVAWHTFELSFDAIRDDALRVCMENLPTSFALPKPTVTLLRQWRGSSLRIPVSSTRSCVHWTRPGSRAGS